MLIKKSGSLEGKIASSEITPKDAFFNRRNFLRAAAVGVGALALKRVPGLIHPEAVHADQQLAAMASKYTVPNAQTPFAKGDDLQQLLRVRHGQVGPGEERAQTSWIQS